MATNSKKTKNKDLGDKKSAKRSEDTTPLEEKKNDGVKSVTECETPAEEEKCESIVPPEEPQEIKEPTPEPVYEEPVLTQLIVER